MILDLRFVDAGYELMILSEYLKLLEAETPEIIERGRERIRRTPHEPYDEGSISISSHLGHRLEEGIMTRFLPASVVMANWAIYEATVNEVSDYIRAKRPVSAEMSRQRGGFLKRARKYFKDSLEFELHPQATDWTRLDRLSTLRTVLAHANGSLREVRKKEDRDRLHAWVQVTPGLRIEDGYVLVSFTFASESIEFVHGLLEDLVERVRLSFPLPRRATRRGSVATSEGSASNITP